MHSESRALVELSNHPTRVTKMKTGYAAEGLQPPAPPGFRSGGWRMEDGGVGGGLPPVDISRNNTRAYTGWT
jgi:hypothetical protein